MLSDVYFFFLFIVNMPYLTHEQLLMFRRIAPADHELSARLRFDSNGSLSSVKLTRGDECTAHHCAVKPCEGGVCLHTHPRGNRVSSADFRVAIETALVKQRTHSIVITPMGVFSYRPTSKLLREWKTYDRQRRDEITQSWKLVGQMLQEKTQAMQMDDFMRFSEEVGMHIEFVSWKDVAVGGELWLN